MVSPGRTTGLRALASSLMFSTLTPRSWATLFVLKSLVMILPSISRASSMSLRSTSLTSGKSFSTICTLTPTVFWMRCRMSSPRRPRLRLMESDESAIICSSCRTNCGSTSTPSRKPVSQMSATRLSMITEVSMILRAAQRRAVGGEQPLEHFHVQQVALVGATMSPT